MAKVDTNAIALSYAREITAGLKATTGWKRLEPNEITQFGAAITTTPREPISDKLQRRKGTPTDLDASVAFGADITVDGLWDWLEAAIFAHSTNSDVRDLPVESVDTTADEYKLLTPLVAANIPKLQADMLIWAYGFADDDNNGLHVLDVDTAAGTQVAVAENLQARTGGTAVKPAGYITLAGYRVPAATEKTWVGAGSHASLALLGNIETDDLAKIFTLGQTVHFGSVLSTGGALTNGLHNGANEVFGYARVVRISANAITFDRISPALVYIGAADTTNALDIIAGDFVRNVSRSHDDYVQQAHTVEQKSPDLFSGPADGYEYGVGQVLGSLVLNFPLTNKATMTVNLIGEDVEKPVNVRLTGPSTAVTPVRGEAFNTSADFARLRITEVDDTGITTDFKSLTLTINPQTSPEKVLGKLGAGSINRGNMQVDTSAQVIFSSAGVLNAIRDNETVRFDVIIGNSEGVFVFEVPSQTLGGGGREYPTNAAVLLNTTGESFEDEVFETSVHVSWIPVPIPTV